MKTFSCNIKKHDLHHLEIKTILPIPLRGKARFDLNFYLYSPAQLHITKENLAIDKVLKQIQTYTRFSSPTLSLEKLIDSECTLSPLYRIRRILEQAEISKEIDEKAIIYELQTLVNTYRSNIKGFIALIEKMLKEGRVTQSSYGKRIERIIQNSEAVLQKLQELYPEFLAPQISDTLRTALRWSDETITLIAERRIIELRSLCEENSTLNSEMESINTFLDTISSYRVQQQYRTVLRDGRKQNGEKVAYRDSILKKWSQSAMYMQAVESRLPKQINHIFAATAAALAMTFAVLAAAYADTLFMRNSIPWAMLIIISYVFKDRIKEILREIFSRLMPKVLADRIVRLKDPETGKIAASSKEIIRFGKDRDQPEDIRKTRNIAGNPFHAILPPQDVLHYNRIIRLKSALLKSHHRLESLSEITRIRIDEWLKSMDDPEEIIDKIEGGKRVRVPSDRVYHIHLIAALQEFRHDTAPQLFHYCLIMNRNGILRVEER